MVTTFFLKMLNREAASPRQKSEKILESLQIQEGYAVADVGSGGGYFTLRFARSVGKTGNVYALDTQSKYLDFIRHQAEREGAENITFVLVSEDEVALPEVSLDLIFARNMFHHLSEPGHHFSRLKRFLKPGGKVAIIDHRPKGGLSFVSLFRHHTPEKFIVQEMEKAGYYLVESFDFLPDQTFTIFSVRLSGKAG
ncbi:MAG: class I SAM-dependent methyltransferase [Desulfomonilia bacterium]|nr:class I SAM-dependent methyltransferase [Desulfomonilia bacterium]